MHKGGSLAEREPSEKSTEDKMASVREEDKEHPSLQPMGSDVEMDDDPGSASGNEEKPVKQGKKKKKKSKLIELQMKQLIQQLQQSTQQLQQMQQAAAAKDLLIERLTKQLETLNNRSALEEEIKHGKRKERSSSEELNPSQKQLRTEVPVVPTNNRFEALMGLEAESEVPSPMATEERSPVVKAQPATKPVSGVRAKKMMKQDDPYATCESDQEEEHACEMKISMPEGTNSAKETTKPTKKDTAPAGAQTTAKPKPLDSPDFVLENLNVAKFEKEMIARNINIDIKIVQSGKQHVKCANEHREAVRTWCKNNGVQGTTSTCNHERQGASIVKGIHVSYEAEEVQEYLESLVDFKISKIRRFAEPKEGEKPFHWWVVTTENRDQTFELKRIKFFRNSCPIKWEPYVSKRCPRCFNCQEYKHLAKNCFKKERCTRCKTAHPRAECKKPPMTANMSFEERQVYWCHPCQLRGHCADSLNCPTKLRYDEEQAERAMTQRTNNSRQATRQGPVRREQPPPSKEDFIVTSRKEARKVPAPVEAQQQPEWSRPGNSQGNKSVSAPYVNAWAEIESTSNDLFGRTPAQMLALCEKFVVQTRNLGKHEKMTEYIRFYSYLSCPRRD